MKMKTRGAGPAAALALAAAAGPAMAGETGGPAHFTAAEITGRVARTTGGLATSQLPTGPNSVVVVARREQTGEPEMHEGMNDVFVAHAGGATVLVGGKIDGHRETAPGEWRGGKITGGLTYQLAPGDLLWIPAGLPHQVIVPKGGAFTYMAFKSPK